ncbi:MAG: tetratricopeptide repeat protein [Vicinamibacterales bacterium]|nr:tetratricopeptide repeat protein [Vicinamibacterales bacterium]
MSDLPPTSSPDPGVTRAAEAAAVASRSFGPYRLLQIIGEGGMGEVWLAEQTTPIRRQVALKVIKAGMDTVQVVARFEAERQALALMDHPAIATVYDGGSTPEGRPYFVMEHVKGEPITTYCDRHKLAMRDRLELFAQVCDGVQHAHQKGVIHRDLKPSNVLVAVQDDRPVPKIIDFGVAKATARQLTDRTLYTELGAMIGTLEYMSPEQAEMGGLDIDTRTDVYALGVILYELLSGTLPFESKELRQAGFVEIQRTIREKEPPRPSTRITRLGGASTAAATNRNTEPRRLASVLRGDLDWVTMRALEKDRTRRYQTVNALAAEVRRYLNHEPVVAGPPSAVYRARKFVRRHRFGVAAAATLVVLLAAFAVTMALQARRIAIERDRANREAETARQVSSFLVGLFEVAKPSEAAANSVTAREILDKGAARIQTDLREQPAVQATLMSTMGAAYHSLGSYKNARTLKDQALALHRQVSGPVSPEAAGALVSLSETMASQAEHKEAEHLAREAVALLRAAPGADDMLARALRELAWALYRQGNAADAESAAREAYGLYARQPNPPDRELAASLSTLGGILFDKADLAGAARAYEEALTLRRRAYGPSHPRTVSASANLAAVWISQGELAKAEAAYREIVALDRQQLGPDHPSLSNSLSNLGAILYLQKKHYEAENYYRQALAIDERAFGRRHPEVATNLTNIGQALTMQKRYGEAEAAFGEAISIKKESLGADHPEVALATTFLADSLCRSGKASEAEVTARAALKINTDRLGKDHPRTKESEGALGCAMVKSGRYGEAEPYMLSFADALEQNTGAEGDAREVAQQIAGMYAAWGKPDKAAEWRKKAGAARD